MGSSRLPGKVLADIGGQPVLTHLFDRLKQATMLDDLVLATTNASPDNVLEEWARDQAIPIYRGSEDDVLGRVIDAHRMMGTDVIVELTGDCAFLDPEIVDLAITSFIHNDCDIVTNTVRRSFPIGMDVQVFQFSALAHVAAKVEDAAVREHVSLYFYEHPETYRIIHLLPLRHWFEPDYRLVLDYEEDLVFLREIWSRLFPRHGPTFSLEQMIELLRDEPQLLDINRHCLQKTAR